jgi:hypothetical protein
MGKSLIYQRSKKVGGVVIEVMSSAGGSYKNEVL